MSRELSYTKRYSFKDMGEEWSECYVVYRPLNYKAVQKLSDMKEEVSSVGVLIDLLKERFIKGKVVIDEVVTDMEADDIGNLPLTEINKLVKDATGTLAQSLDEK